MRQTIGICYCEVYPVPYIVVCLANCWDGKAAFCDLAIFLKRVGMGVVMEVDFPIKCAWRQRLFFCCPFLAFSFISCRSAERDSVAGIVCGTLCGRIYRCHWWIPYRDFYGICIGSAIAIINCQCGRVQTRRVVGVRDRCLAGNRGRVVAKVPRIRQGIFTVWVSAL